MRLILPHLVSSSLFCVLLRPALSCPSLFSAGLLHVPFTCTHSPPGRSHTTFSCGLTVLTHTRTHTHTLLELPREAGQTHPTGVRPTEPGQRSTLPTGSQYRAQRPRPRAGVASTCALTQPTANWGWRSWLPNEGLVDSRQQEAAGGLCPQRDGRKRAGGGAGPGAGRALRDGGNAAAAGWLLGVRSQSRAPPTGWADPRLATQICGGPQSLFSGLSLVLLTPLFLLPGPSFSCPSGFPFYLGPLFC